MLRNTNQLKGLTIHATDGELGTASELYFDDESWAIRYLTVETGGWLGGRQVLVSPYSILRMDMEARRVDVALTKKQVADSPKIDTHQPVSRQHEVSYLNYYGYPYYWGGPYLWGPGYYPSGLAIAPIASQAATLGNNLADSHLRSTDAVAGYHIDAVDGEIGAVNGFLFDDESWAIRYFESATRNWWPGKDVIFSPAWIKQVSWTESKVFVGLTREAIKTCPEYIESRPITRDYENKVYLHYGRPPYWLRQEDHKSLFSVAAV
jgi:PRC-barrel domain protein